MTNDIGFENEEFRECKQDEIVIRRYLLEWRKVQDIVVPGYPHIISIKNQNGQLYVFCEVYDRPYIQKRKRRILIRSTGVPFNIENDRYLGTIETGNLAFHVYDGGDAGEAK